MPTLSINNKEVTVQEGSTIIQACEQSGIEIPRFCYHERLSIAGNCRMCLVEVEGGPPKPVASCAMPANEGMKVHTNTPMVKKAREGVMEFLLANHPLDCPICDQGGECDLQDQAYQYGQKDSEFVEHKRSVKEKNLGPLIKTTMTRCIHCTRCVRFTTDVAGVEELGAIGRGETMEITSYLEKSMTSELSANVVDLCPVGALTAKPQAFKSRSWELKKCETIDVMDAMASNIRIDYRGLEVMRILPRLNEEINEEWISDKTRYAYDGLKYQRLDSAYIKKDGKLKKAKSSEAYKLIAEKIKELKGQEISAISGKLSSVNEIFALKKLMEKLDSSNYDCRTKGEALSSKDRASYLFNTTIKGIEESDACLLIGVNPRKDAPVLNAKITKKSLDKSYKIGAIGVKSDITYKYQDLGDDVLALEKLLDDDSDFGKTLKKAKNPLIILGQDAISSKNGQEVLNLAKKVAEKYNATNNFNFLSQDIGLINGLEVGFDAAKTEEILKNKLVFLLGVDDNIDFDALKNSFVIYIGSHGDTGAHHADVILPSFAYTEKDSIYVNLEGRPQKTTRAVFGPESTKDGSQIIIEIANKLNLNLGFKNLAELESEIFKTHPNLAKIDEIVENKWQNAKDCKDLDKSAKIEAKDYDFYQSNAIARSSRILAKCSNEIK